MSPKPLAPGSPFLTHVGIHEDRVVLGVHPFDVPVIANGLSLDLTTPVTLLVGENGSGKSTLLEALAWAVGFGAQGGSRDHAYVEATDGHALGRALKLSWRQRATEGFFLRAETFFNLASTLEASGTTFGRYGGKSLHQQSHGEAFLALFEHRFEDGLFILDEPEAALSPQRQLAFLRILHRLTAPRVAQFIIATHSPLLLTFPKGARPQPRRRGNSRGIIRGHGALSHHAGLPQCARALLSVPARGRGRRTRVLTRSVDSRRARPTRANLGEPIATGAGVCMLLSAIWHHRLSHMA